MSNTKRAIFEAAIKIFSNSGYDGATMDDIAVSAGVAKGTLYYHFKSKEEIFKYIITEGMDVIKQKIQEETDKVEDPLDKIKLLCRVQLYMVYENRDFFKVIMSQLWGQEIRHLQIRDLIEDYIFDLEKYLKYAKDKGAIDIAHTTFMAYTMFGTICSAAVYELINKEDTEVEQVVENLMKYILKGIQA